VLPRRAGGHAPTVFGAAAARDGAPGTGHTHARPERAGASLSRARGARRPANHQGPGGQATDLLLRLDRQLRRPARPRRLSGGRGVGASRAGATGGAERQRPTVTGPGLPERGAPPATDPKRASMTTDQLTRLDGAMDQAALSPDVERPPYLWAGLVALGALILYVATLAPTTQFWDTSEYIAAAYVLGIPHPPGNPLFTLIAHTWGLMPLAAAYAERINLLAAVTSAVAAGCWFLVGERWMRSWVPARLPRRLAAVAGALSAATAFTVWNQSVVNEKVYTLSLLSIALVLWVIARWDDQPPGEGHDRQLMMTDNTLEMTSRHP